MTSFRFYFWDFQTSKKKYIKVYYGGNVVSSKESFSSNRGSSRNLNTHFFLVFLVEIKRNGFLSK